MATSCKDVRFRTEKEFCVIQFKELPFQSIDVYVCVPRIWLIVKSSDGKAVVAYPNDEEPFKTKARVIRQERYRDDWQFYLANIKYESDCYCDAEYWIAKNDDGSIKGEDKDRKYIVPTPVLVNKSQSLCLTLNSSGDKPKWIPKINKAAKSNNTMRTNIKPWSSKRNPTIVIRNNQLISAETKESSATFNSKNIAEKTIKSFHVTEDKPLAQPGHLNAPQSTSSTLLSENTSSLIYQDRENGADTLSSDVHESDEVIIVDQDIKRESIEERKSSSNQPA